MNGYDDCRTYVEHLRIEHSHIDHSLEELQHLLANAAQWSQENPAPALLARLVQLREQLVHTTSAKRKKVVAWRRPSPGLPACRKMYGRCRPNMPVF